jgi:hypothetical protein
MGRQNSPMQFILGILLYILAWLVLTRTIDSKLASPYLVAACVAGVFMMVGGSFLIVQGFFL